MIMNENKFNEIFVNWDKLITDAVGCDMEKKVLLYILKTWNIPKNKLYEFIVENEIERKVLEKLAKNGPINRTSISFVKEVIIHGLEEYVRQLFEQGIKPCKLEVESDPFLDTCKEIKYKGWFINFPILPRTRLF